MSGTKNCGTSYYKQFVPQFFVPDIQIPFVLWMSVLCKCPLFLLGYSIHTPQILHRWSIVLMEYLWRIDVLFMENQRWIRKKQSFIFPCGMMKLYFLFLEKEIYFFFATFFGAAFAGAALTGSAGFSTASKPSMPMSSTLKISIE